MIILKCHNFIFNGLKRLQLHSYTVLKQNIHLLSEYWSRACRFQQNKSSFQLHTIRYVHSSLRRLKVEKFILSDIGEGIREVMIKEWFVKVGDKISQFDDICEVQSDKATVTITSRYDGVIKKIYHKLNDTVLVGHPLIDIEMDGLDESVVINKIEDDINDSKKLSSNILTEKNIHEYLKPLATPSVRRIALENKIDLKHVSASGKGGRVLKEDIMQFIQQQNSQIIQDSSKKGDTSEDIVVLLTGIKAVMKKTMTNTLKIPDFSYCDEIDLTELKKLRESINKRFEKENGFRLSFMPFIIKAVSVALKEYPILNSHVDDECTKYTIKASHNIGIAMDTQLGLLVPNIKNVQNLSIIEIAKELNKLQKAGKAGKLSVSNLTGGTFSLSNIGSMGGTYTRPLILAPEISIGGLGKIQRLPRFDREDNVYPAYIMNVSWSCDHRIIDGATIANFSNRWRNMLEDPSSIVIELV